MVPGNMYKVRGNAARRIGIFWVGQLFADVLAICDSWDDSFGQVLREQAADHKRAAGGVISGRVASWPPAFA